MDAIQLNLLHDYARAIARIKDDLFTAVSEIETLAININVDIAKAKDDLIFKLAVGEPEDQEERTAPPFGTQPVKEDN